jgi:sec-independent protein translocase protein TatA
MLADRPVEDGRRAGFRRTRTGSAAGQAKTLEGRGFMAPSIWQLLIVLVIVLVLFGGRGKIASMMGDLGKGISSFKKNVKDEAASGEPSDDGKKIESEPAKSEAADTTAEKDKAAG